MSSIDIETAGRIIGSLHNTTFACPHCGHEYEGSEGEVAQYVVSYWGDEGDHDFTCQQCGQDFIVREIVMRHFEVAKTRDELDD